MDTTAANGQRYPDTVLRVVEKSQRAGDVALLVVGALLGSFRTPVAKEDYKGTKIDSVTHPYKTALAPALERVVDAWLTEKQDTRPLKNPFWIRPNTFSLVFENFSDEEPMFEFWLNTSVSRKPDSAGWLSAPVAVNCNTTGLKRKLVEWQADDFAAVKKLADEHVKDCAKKTADQLTALLKD